MPDFSIEFELAFDDTDLSPEDREAYHNALVAAAEAWSQYISDDFDPVRPGTTFDIVNPSDSSISARWVNDKPIDDILIFVGWDDLGDFRSEGESQRITGGLAYSGSTSFFGDALSARIVDNFRGQGPVTDYEPWTGSITFNSRLLPRDSSDAPTNALDTSFSFGEDAEPDKVHFISTAVHEIGHILGLGSSPAFEAQVINNVFVGENALSLTEDIGIPLEADGGHVLDGYAGNSVAMDPVDQIGTKKLPGQFDLAMLADIGYHISGATGGADPAPEGRQGEKFDVITENGERISGTTARDILYAQGGDDTVFGNDGDDVLSGEGGSDWLVGGEGADVFEYGFGSGADTIQDFVFGEDLLRISSHYGLTPQQIAEEAVILNTSDPNIGVIRIDFDDGNLLTVQYDKSSGDGLRARDIVVANTDRGGFSSPIWQSDLDTMPEALWRDQSAYWTSYGGHGGIDFPAPEGTPIRAIADGTVIRASSHYPKDDESLYSDGFGELVVIEHDENAFSLYGHLSAFGPGLEDFTFSASQPFQVKAGEIIGYVGDTGYSFGGHLHFNYFVDPSTDFRHTGSTGVDEALDSELAWVHTGDAAGDRTDQHSNVREVSETLVAEADQPSHTTGGLGVTTWDRQAAAGATVFFDGIIDRLGEKDTFAFIPEEGRTYLVTATGAPIRDYHALEDPLFNIRKSEDGPLVPLVEPALDAPGQLLARFEAQDSEVHYIRLGTGADVPETGGYTLIIEDVTLPEAEIFLAVEEAETYAVTEEKATTIFGRLAELIDDVISNFNNDDEFRVQEETIAPEQFNVREGSAILEVDTDGDGIFETSWTLLGDFSGGEFFLIPGENSTTIAYAVITSGGEGSDSLQGNDGRDRIFGFGGNDALSGGGGSDQLVDGVGADLLSGDSGDDTISLSGTTYHTAQYSAYNVSSVTQTGTDQRINLAGKVKIEAVIDGGADVDTINLSDQGDAFFLHDAYSGFHHSLALSEDYVGNESTQRFINVQNINGLDGNDIIDLTSPDYSLAGETIRIDGGEGNDVIWGSDADETINGGIGNDTIFGGIGTDLLIGGAGADTFQFTRTSTVTTVEDFDPTTGDTLEFFNNGGATFDPTSLTLTATGVRVAYDEAGTRHEIDIVLAASADEFSWSLAQISAATDFL
jgi:Ca2+-binding RTX toxin-like protein